MFTFEIHGAEEFRTWLRTVKGRFSIMLEAMRDVASLIQANTLPKTPYQTGQLGESFQIMTLSSSRGLIEVEVKMDAVDPVSGFHYAEYQHNENLNHSSPRRGMQFYLREGIKASESMAYELIETDYLSMFGRVKGGYYK